jgi:hypothetical protein
MTTQVSIVLINNIFVLKPMGNGLITKIFIITQYSLF